MPKVLNKYKDNIPKDAVYIGRPSKWGNPFIIGKDGDRVEVYNKYLNWLSNNEELKRQARLELRGKDLVCYCAPLKCHGDALLVISNEICKTEDNKLNTSDSIKPSEDGIAHINIYSHGKTVLGRLLSHFAKIGFDHPKYGRFESIEAFWYWSATGKKHDELRNLHGFLAKMEGNKYEKVYHPFFLIEMEEAITYKITQNEDLLFRFKESTLPFKHYYVYGNGDQEKIVVPGSSAWVEDFYDKLREKLKNNVEDKHG